MKFSGVFPGQGSQSVGMFSEFAVQVPSVKETFQEASALLDYSLWELVQDGPVEKLNLTEYTQPAMLAAGVAAWRVWQSRSDLEPVAVAGHSLGEYSALVAADALDLDVGTRLVSLRGKLMQSAVPEGIGAIAAIMGLSAQEVAAVCETAAQNQVLQAVNFNSANQIVIAGHREAIERGMAAAKAAGAKRAILLPVSAPVHSSLMTAAAERFAEELDKINFRAPRFPVFQNLEAKANTSIAEIKATLVQHINHPVLWMATIQNMAAAGSQAFVEFGPGKVLAGLCKRIERNVDVYAVDGMDGLETALAGLANNE